MSPSLLNLPPTTLSHTSRLSQSAGGALSHSEFPLAVLHMVIYIYVSALLFQFVSPSPPPTVSRSLLPMSVSFAAL